MKRRYSIVEFYIAIAAISAVLGLLLPSLDSSGGSADPWAAVVAYADR